MPVITLHPDGRTTLGRPTGHALLKSTAEDSDLASLSLLKSVDARQFTLGLAYPVNRADIARARDGKKDFAGREVVERAAWRWMAKGHSVGLLHVDGTEGHGTVVESGLHRGPDWLMKSADGTEQTIVDGDWLLGVIWDDPSWSLIKSGHVKGFSPQGHAKRREPSAAAIAQLRTR